MSACNPDVLRPNVVSISDCTTVPRAAYFLCLFVKSSLWGRRRDVHTVLGWFEPGLQAPLAKAYTAFQACTLPSYVTAATCESLSLAEYLSFQRDRTAKN